MTALPCNNSMWRKDQEEPCVSEWLSVRSTEEFLNHERDLTISESLKPFRIFGLFPWLDVVMAHDSIIHQSWPLTVWKDKRAVEKHLPNNPVIRCGSTSVSSLSCLFLWAGTHVMAPLGCIVILYRLYRSFSLIICSSFTGPRSSSLTSISVVFLLPLEFSSCLLLVILYCLFFS